MIPDPIILQIAKAVAAKGGRALIVGGYVRDMLLGFESKDIDIEVYNLEINILEKVLSTFGPVIAVGREFGVLRIKGLEIDFSLPRKDQKVSPGHKGFMVTTDPNLTFNQASKRRDLTINSIGYDPLTKSIIDPHNGQKDLQKGILKATDKKHFSEDPLRGIRVAQFAARFSMNPDQELLDLCAALDLSELSAERIFEEFRKLLLKGKKPSVGFEILRKTNLLRFFPELRALVGLPQDSHWHPEGTVWEHTMLVVDEAAKLRDGGDDDLTLMFGALCHDFGKPKTTTEENGRIRSLSHAPEGVVPCENFLMRMKAPKLLTMKVKALVEHHLAPALFIRNKAGPKGYRKLARQLEEVGVSMELLARVARADHLGRKTPDALAGQFPAGDKFLQKATELRVEQQAPPDVVGGRHLIARGLSPGKHFGAILAKCRDLQDEKGWEDPDQILDVVLEHIDLTTKS